MKSITRALSLFLVLSILLASCSSTTLITSNPPKAKLYINGAYVGVTPYYHTDTKIMGSVLDLKIEKEGYNPLITSISKTEEADIGAIVGGVFFLVPFLWTMGYQPSHDYELQPLSTQTKVSAEPSITTTVPAKSKVDKLRELKGLLDDKIINADEFEKEKAKILQSAD